MQWALLSCADGFAVCGSRRKLSCALRRVFDNILSNAAKYSAGDLTVTLTPDGAVTFANHAPNLSCVQANQLVDRFFTVETARARPGGGAGERRRGPPVPGIRRGGESAGNLAPGDSF